MRGGGRAGHSQLGPACACPVLHAHTPAGGGHDPATCSSNTHSAPTLRLGATTTFRRPSQMQLPSSPKRVQGGPHIQMHSHRHVLPRRRIVKVNHVAVGRRRLHRVRHVPLAHSADNSTCYKQQRCGERNIAARPRTGPPPRSGPPPSRAGQRAGGSLAG